MNLRNTILLAGLSLFLLWYVSDWAYKSQYREPRKRLDDEIAKLSGEIEWGENRYAQMAQFSEQNMGFYFRSLPRAENDARSQYSLWLLELLQFCGFENTDVKDNAPSLVRFGTRELFWADYLFNIQCTGTLLQLSRFLFQFYHDPYLHRITSMTLIPVEGNPEKKTFVIAVNALALRPRLPNDPYPPVNQLPVWDNWRIPRLATTDESAYQVIADRDLLRTARGGVDRADYTFLTGILLIGDQKEVWFSVRTEDDLTIRLQLGEVIDSGSFSGKIVEILEQDIVLDRDGSRWLLTTGESLNEAFALPPETEW